jgi:hypothetical protein
VRRERERPTAEAAGPVLGMEPEKLLISNRLRLARRLFRLSPSSSARLSAAMVSD